jgi:hypothetical protein
MSIAGHVSAKMFAHYSHVRLHAKRTALDGLATGRRDTSTRDSYDTNNDTKQGKRGEQLPQVIEKMVELVGIELLSGSEKKQVIDSR